MSAPQPDSSIRHHVTSAVDPATVSSSDAASSDANSTTSAATTVSTDAVPDANSKNATPTEPPANESQTHNNVPASWLWLTKHDQTFVAVCVAVFLALTGYHWAKLGGWGMQPLEVDRLPARQYDFRIDINSASWVEWTQIEGIGEVTANKIISDREAKGPFRNINDLLRVKGIGPKTLEKLRPYLREPNAENNTQK